MCKASVKTRLVGRYHSRPKPALSLISLPPPPRGEVDAAGARTHLSIHCGHGRSSPGAWPRPFRRLPSLSARAPLPHPLHSFACAPFTRLLPRLVARALPVTHGNGGSLTDRHGGAHETPFPYSGVLRVAPGKHMATRGRGGRGGKELAAAGWRGKGDQTGSMAPCTSHATISGPRKKCSLTTK